MLASEQLGIEAVELSGGFRDLQRAALFGGAIHYPRPNAVIHVFSIQDDVWSEQNPGVSKPSRLP